MCTAACFNKHVRELFSSEKLHIATHNCEHEKTAVGKRSFSARRRTSTPHKKIVVFPVSTHKRYISSKFPSFPHSPLHFSSTVQSNYVCSFICSTDVVIHTWVHYVSPSYQWFKITPAFPMVAFVIKSPRKTRKGVLKYFSLERP